MGYIVGMKGLLNSTNKIVELNGVPARIWEGETAGGSKCIAFVTRIAVPEGEDASEFERELQETDAPSAEFASFPLRMIL